MSPSAPNLHDVKARELFAAAADQPSDQRTAYLDAACAGNLELHEHVAQLFKAHDRAGDFLVDGDTDADQSPGARIGPYIIERYLGEGGFGAVYLARQEHPVRRNVALKIIKPGMDSRQVIARFEAERQALAIMDHPNIARVFDAGATDSGRPYFAMEWVQGVPITRYCDEHHLSTRQRLDLFVQVCRAVQHAHTKGVIHRDIKPSNILVADAEPHGKPLPKVIDFGIAKATNQSLTDRTLLTEARQLIGTPEYMSPEQADPSSRPGGAIDIDTRSDVYSLGVLLYELLTGTTPFDAKDLREKAFAEMQRIIREVDPPRPSTRLGTLIGDTLTSVAAHRSTEPRRLSQSLRGELDWIVMKALEKERARRYEAAGDLAADVERYLRDELVHARPPSRAYLLRKLFRRHRLLISAGAAIAAAIVIGMALALWGLKEARDERDVAARALANEARLLKRANDANTKARLVNDLLRDLHVAANRRRTGSDEGLLAALAEGAARLETGVLDDQPDLEASMRTTLGNIYATNGLWDEAEQQLQRSLNLRKRIHPASGHPDLADSQSDLAWTLHSRGDDEKAEALLWQSLRMREKKDPDNHDALASNLHSLGLVVRSLKREEHAVDLFRRSLNVRIKQATARIDAAPAVAQRWADRAHLHARRGDFARAAHDYAQAIERDPNDHWWWYQLTALRLYVNDKPAYENDCREMYRRFATGHPPEVAHRAAKSCLLVPDPPIDLAQLRQTVDPSSRAPNAGQAGWMRLTRGMLEYRCGNFDAALYWLQRGRDSNVSPFGVALADYYAAMSLHHKGQHEQARGALRKALALTPPDAYTLTDPDPNKQGASLHGWLIAQLARREAESLVKLPATMPTTTATRPTPSQPSDQAPPTPEEPPP